MDGTTLDVLLVAAVSIAFLHTVIGVDHFLPFVVLGRARHWPLRKVLGITALCGLGHELAGGAIATSGVAIRVLGI